MDKESIRAFCLSLPYATEQVQWEYDLLFKVGGKMFVVVNLEPAELTHLSLKCTPETYAELIERDGVLPNKYLKRYHWIEMHSLDSFKRKEIENLIRASYEMVFEKLPQKLKRQLAEEG